MVFKSETKAKRLRQRLFKAKTSWNPSWRRVMMVKMVSDQLTVERRRRMFVKTKTLS